MNRLRKLIGLFMMILVIGIPFHISFAFADTGTLSGLNITGEDGISNVLQDTDSLKMSVTAKMADDNGAPVSLNENNLRMVYNGYEEKFSKCLSVGDSFLCQYTSGDREWEPGRKSIQVKLYDNYFFRLDALDGTFYVDSSPPDIKGFDFKMDSANGIEADYDVEDSACSGCNDYCSGIDKIEFTFDGVVKQTLEGGEGCLKSSNITFSPESLGLEEGSTEFCINAYDNFGAKSTSCKNIYIDYNPPEITGLNITYNGLPLKYTSLTPIEAVVSVEISDEASGVSEGSIWGDFSALNTITPDNYRKVSPDCQGTDNSLECTWDVLVDGVDGNVQIFINATDNSGLSAQISKTLNLKLDREAPSIVSIDSGHANDNGTKFLKKDDNTIIAKIDESGAGMGKGEAYLNLYSLNQGYGSVQADSCNYTGGYWYCYWNRLTVAAKQNGQKIEVQVQKLVDDMGNRWQGASGISRQEFVFDDEKPGFVNITIKPLGADIDVLRETDIASVVAYIKEQYSGLESANVLADFSQFNSEINYSTPADSCEEVSDSLWECDWEYSGNYDAAQTAKVSVTATDNAGNTKDSSADGAYGTVYIAKVTNKKADFWEDEAESYDVNKLNRNFLFMSSHGTIIRSGVRLVPLSGRSYVHDFTLTSCQGTLVIPNTEDTLEAYTVKDQFYYPDTDRSDKYALIEIPHYDNNSLYNATGVKILCTGEVIQGRAKNSDVYSPNEMVNVTINVPLTGKLFSSPDISTIDKITEKKSQLDSLNTLINWIDFWVKLLQPLCQLFQLLRQLIDGICVLYQGFAYWQWGSVNSCYFQSWKLDRYWYGYTPEELKGMEGGTMDQKMTKLMEDNAKDHIIPQSTKKYFSFGYVCDLVLCEDCSNFWGDKFGQEMSKTMNGYLHSIYPTPNNDIKDAQFNFDPQKSLIVSVWCSPPCLPGILAKLKTYKAVLITYNVCVNAASVNPNMDVAQCDDYYDTQVCDLVVGEFWYLVDEFLKSIIVNYALYGIKKGLIQLAGCPSDWPSNAVTGSTCTAYKIYATIGWFMKLSETVDTIDQIANHKFFSQSDQDTEDGAKEKITGVTGKDKQFVRQ